MKTLLQLIQECQPGDAWSGIGSRRCKDQTILSTMTHFAEVVAYHKLTMRSGAAIGPDTAFENGTPPEQREIYLPNKEFENRDLRYAIVPKDLDIMVWMKAGMIAEQFHDAGRHMDGNLRSLMTRNVYQVLGPKLRTPSKFVLCDAPEIIFDEDGLVKDVDGGTGQAVRVAYSRNIPVFVMSIPEHMAQVHEAMQWLKNTYKPNLSASPATITPPKPPAKPYQPKLF